MMAISLLLGVDLGLDHCVVLVPVLVVLLDGDGLHGVVHDRDFGSTGPALGEDASLVGVLGVHPRLAPRVRCYLGRSSSSGDVGTGSPDPNVLLPRCHPVTPLRPDWKPTSSVS